MHGCGTARPYGYEDAGARPLAKMSMVVGRQGHTVTKMPGLGPWVAEIFIRTIQIHILDHNRLQIFEVSIGIHP